MKKSLIILSVLLSFALLTSGCATTSSSGASSQTFSVADIQPQPPSLMVAKKFERPLYIVVDPAKIQEIWPLETMGRTADLVDFGTFFRRDVKKTMEAYFAQVEIISSARELPETPHIIADVKVDRVRVNDRVVGHLTYAIIEMNWGFALRPNESDDYIYSYAGVNTSDNVYSTFEEGLTQMFENAITTMTSGWVEKDGVKDLRKYLDQSPPSAEDGASNSSDSPML